MLCHQASGETAEIVTISLTFPLSSSTQNTPSPFLNEQYPPDSPSILATDTLTHPNFKQHNLSLQQLLNYKPKLLNVCQFLANEQFRCLSNLEK